MSVSGVVFRFAVEGSLAEAKGSSEMIPSLLSRIKTREQRRGIGPNTPAPSTPNPLPRSPLRNSTHPPCSTLANLPPPSPQIFARYTMGWYPGKLVVVLNIIVLLGYALIDCVIAGQILSAVSPEGSMSVIVGTFHSPLGVFSTVTPQNPVH